MAACRQVAFCERVTFDARIYSLMSVTGLFSGIGGFELAFNEVGFESQTLVELDPAATAVLKARFPGAEILRDVLDLDDLPMMTSILTAGFPCQNLSMAGDKTGISGTKSSIVQKMFELIRGSGVPTVVIENVYFMLQLDSGEGMNWMVEQFERLGYAWAYRVLDSMGFGLPQRRRRVYFIASREIDPRTVLFADEQPVADTEHRDLSRPLGFYWTEGRSGIGLTVDGIPPLKVGSSLGIVSPPAVLFPDGEVLAPSVTACERLQGYAAGWTEPADMPASRRNSRWRLVGNAVSVPVAKWVAGRIKNPGAVLDFPRVSQGARRAWPDAAWNVGDGRVDVVASDKPVQFDRPSISDFRDSSWSRLSERALNGFINRAMAGGLRTPEGFLKALRAAERKPVVRAKTDRGVANGLSHHDP
jgi:DNA (cytosine-5)-methyltransferase 1